MLTPQQWLNDATSWAKTYAQDSSSCRQYKPNQDPVCIILNGTTLKAQGSYPEAPR